MINCLEDIKDLPRNELICGIDPGVSGSICILRKKPLEHVEYIYLWDTLRRLEMMDVVLRVKMPDTFEEVAELLEVIARSVQKVYVERIPKTVGVNRPSAKMFSLFVNYGLAVGAFNLAQNCPFYHVDGKFIFHQISPQKWMNFYKSPRSVGNSYSDRKKYHLEITRELWPSLKWTHQLGESPLIALAGNMIYP